MCKWAELESLNIETIYKAPNLPVRLAPIHVRFAKEFAHWQPLWWELAERADYANKVNQSIDWSSWTNSSIDSVVQL